MCHWTLILLMYNFPDTLLPSLDFSQQLSFFLLKVVRDKGQSGRRYLKPYWLTSTRGLRSSRLHLHPLTRLCTWLQFPGQSPFWIPVCWYQPHLLTSPQSWFKKQFQVFAASWAFRGMFIQVVVASAGEDMVLAGISIICIPALSYHIRIYYGQLRVRSSQIPFLR